VEIGRACSGTNVDYRITCAGTCRVSTPWDIPGGIIAGSASDCRHARADHMMASCKADEDCQAAYVNRACTGPPLKMTCENGKCRSRHTDGCEPPFTILDPDTMRKMIVECAPD
jgi:hypothetical protein